VGVTVRWWKSAWWVIVHHQGKRTVKRVGADRKVAEVVARKIRAQLVLGHFNLRERDASLGFQCFANEWLRREVELPIMGRVTGALAWRTGKIHRGHLTRYLIPFFGSKDVREIRVADVQDLYARCLETGKPRSARSIELILATLRRVLAHAQARELVVANAVAAWKGDRGRRRSASYRVGRERVLDSSELARLLAVAAQDFPEHFPLVLFLADTGARIGEALALRWIDVDLGRGDARICRSSSDGREPGETKTGRERTVELSSRLRDELAARRPELFGEDALVFPSRDGGLLDPHNFRSRVFDRAVRKALGADRRFSPHGLRHTFATLHLARGRPIKWIQAHGGWSSAKILLDWYGHFLPSEQHGFADSLTTSPDATQTSPATRSALLEGARRPKTAAPTRGLSGAPGRIRTCDPSLRRGTRHRGITRACTREPATGCNRRQRDAMAAHPRTPGAPWLGTERAVLHRGSGSGLRAEGAHGPPRDAKASVRRD